MSTENGTRWTGAWAPRAHGGPMAFSFSGFAIANTLPISCSSVHSIRIARTYTPRTRNRAAEAPLSRSSGNVAPSGSSARDATMNYSSAIRASSVLPLVEDTLDGSFVTCDASLRHGQPRLPPTLNLKASSSSPATVAVMTIEGAIVRTRIEGVGAVVRAIIVAGIIVRIVRAIVAVAPIRNVLCELHGIRGLLDHETTGGDRRRGHGEATDARRGQGGEKQSFHDTPLKSALCLPWSANVYRNALEREPSGSFIRG